MAAVVVLPARSRRVLGRRCLSLICAPIEFYRLYVNYIDRSARFTARAEFQHYRERASGKTDYFTFYYRPIFEPYCIGQGGGRSREQYKQTDKAHCYEVSGLHIKSPISRMSEGVDIQYTVSSRFYPVQSLRAFVSLWFSSLLDHL
jgi:hypothetical protein